MFVKVHQARLLYASPEGPEKRDSLTKVQRSALIPGWGALNQENDEASGRRLDGRRALEKEFP